MDTLLYENAMQVVPVLVIAAFLDGGTATGTYFDGRVLRRLRTQDRISAVTALTAFMLSMLVVAGVVPPSSGTLAVVVSAIGGTIGLLLVGIWRRLDHATEPAGPPSSSRGHAHPRPTRHDRGPRP